MINYRYYKISKSIKIRYINKIQKNAPYIVFLHGFMSSLEGEKPKEFWSFAEKNNIILLIPEGDFAGVFRPPFDVSRLSLTYQSVTSN